MSNTAQQLQQEWLALHRSYDVFERISLIIKLVNIMVFIIMVVLNQSVWLSLTMIGLIWLLEGIWKTFQARTESRLLQLESMLKEGISEPLAFQFYSGWNEQRPSPSDLVQEYLTQAMRPTVAFPHAALLILSVLFL